MKQTLRERWIEAMCRVPQSLVGFEGYTQAQADIVCGLLRRDAPAHPREALVLALERETVGSESITITRPQRKPRQPRPNPDDYPAPWCKVTKDGQLLRWEDAHGGLIPRILWPVMELNV